MKVFYLNEKATEYIDIEDDLKVFYKMLNCSQITIPTFKVDGKEFDVICDDEGLLKQRNVSAVDKDGSPMLVGNLIFAHHDDEGDLTSITDEEAELLRRNVLLAKDEKGKIFPVIGNVSYY